MTSVGSPAAFGVAVIAEVMRNASVILYGWKRHRLWSWLPSFLCLSIRSGTQCLTQTEVDSALLTRCLIWYLKPLTYHTHCDMTQASTAAVFCPDIIGFYVSQEGTVIDPISTVDNNWEIFLNKFIVILSVVVMYTPLGSLLLKYLYLHMTSFKCMSNLTE